MSTMQSNDPTPASSPVEPTQRAAVDPVLEQEFLSALERATRKVRDPEITRKACERMDRMREETYRKHGVLDIGTPAIRELRDA